MWNDIRTLHLYRSTNRSVDANVVTISSVFFFFFNYFEADNAYGTIAPQIIADIRMEIVVFTNLYSLWLIPCTEENHLIDVVARSLYIIIITILTIQSVSVIIHCQLFLLLSNGKMSQIEIHYLQWNDKNTFLCKGNKVVYNYNYTYPEAGDFRIFNCFFFLDTWHYVPGIYWIWVLIISTFFSRRTISKWKYVNWFKITQSIVLIIYRSP